MVLGVASTFRLGSSRKRLRCLGRDGPVQGTHILIAATRCAEDGILASAAGELQNDVAAILIPEEVADILFDHLDQGLAQRALALAQKLLASSQGVFLADIDGIHLPSVTLLFVLAVLAISLRLDLKM